MFKIVSISAILFLLSSCVSMKEFEEQSAKSNKYLAEKKDCNDKLKSTSQKLEETQSELDKLKLKNDELISSIENLSKSSKELNKLMNEEKSLREKTDKNYEKHMLNSSKKQEALLLELTEKERALTKREADINKIQKDILERENQLKEIKNEIFAKESSLSEAQKLLNEKMVKISVLESKLESQRKAMLDLKNNISSALKDFNSDELTIEEKEGKIFVSLSEKLLFKPGSFVLDKNGEKALSKLAKALLKQKEVDIVVEGHTDSDAFKGNGPIKDNWDLSVKRATSVVRILVKNKVPKNKIIASGRGMNKPVADNNTKEGKAKNRRTEIILSPNIEKLFDILKDN